MSTVTAKQSDVPMFEAKQQKRGIGILELLGPQGRVELPLTGVRISAKVSSFVAEVSVQQTFKNPSSESLEAEYIFPLAGGCAVGHFELRVAGRVIVGQVQERGEARRHYEQAIAEGKRAAILEQERSNVFTVKVGNLPPGEEATVQLTYSERLSFFEDGSGELRLPLVVAPRFIAGDEQSRPPSGSGTANDTDRVPDASRLSPPRLAAGFDPKVSLKIEVELMRGVDESGGETGFDELACSQHATRTSAGSRSIKVQLARAEKLDRDFVLRWRMGSSVVTSSMQVYAPEPGANKERGAGFALVTLVPPRREGFLGMARDVVFVVDRSGSMQGVKMTSASTACALLLRTLGPRDRFAVQAFDTVCEWKDGGSFCAADEAGVDQGEQFLRGISPRGGTALDLAMSEAIGALARRKKSDEAGLPIIVLLTDGQVGDESSVLKRLQTSLDDARVFTVGIDTAVNDGFLRRLSAIGGGTATFVEPGSALEEALRAVGREIGSPLITDLKIADAGSGLEMETLAPNEIPDLFEGRPASVFVRVKHAKAVELSGTYVDGSKFKQSVKAQEMALPALAQLWAKARVTELEDRFRLARSAGLGKESADELRREIIALACEHTLLTRFTAFLAVDQEIVNAGGEQKKLLQPVEVPADWSAEAVWGSPAPAPSTMARGLSGMPPPPAAPSAKRKSLVLGTRSSPKPMRPMSPAPAPMKKADEAGLLRKVANAIGGKGSSRDRTAQPPALAPETGGQMVSPETIAAIKSAMARLSAALVEIQRELTAGGVPSQLQLEAARDGLLKLLATFAEAASFPLLQRFLRTGAAELVAALRSKANAKSLLPLADRHLATWAAAQAEADRALAKLGAKAAEPWEASI